MEDTWWDAPWGEGRPGWHIECSAMAEATLGSPFEIHGGGNDLIFPHHENEAAQTRAARGHDLARIWMHNGMLELGGKMSKSVGNIRGLAEVLDDVGRETLLMFFAEGHYRQPLAFSPEKLADAARRVEGIRNAGRRLVPGDSPAALARHRDAFFDALADDYNTPRALAALAEWIREANGADAPVGDGHLREMLAMLGLEDVLAAEAGAPAEVAALAEQRAAARAARDFAEADRLRDELRARGWEVRDGPAGAELVPIAARDRLRPQRGARGDPRAAARADRLGDEGRRAGVPGRDAGRRARDRPARGDRRAPGGRAPTSRTSLRRRGRRCSRAPDPVLVALDEVTDPQNLGAVGAHGGVHGRHGR